ncbi:MAG: hypothetical protein ACREJ2_06585, partial [Planctomycetota bacterium]
MANIHFVCPNCAKNLKVPDMQAGRKGRCPFCRAKVRIPAEDLGVAELLAAGRGDSDVAPAQQPSVALAPSDAPVLAAPEDPSADFPPTPSPAPGNDLQSQLDRQLADATAEHSHRPDAATLKYAGEEQVPVIRIDDGSGVGSPLPPPSLVVSAGALFP